jgi:hypothetical protein
MMQCLPRAYVNVSLPLATSMVRCNTNSAIRSIVQLPDGGRRLAAHAGAEQGWSVLGLEGFPGGFHEDSQTGLMAS